MPRSRLLNLTLQFKKESRFLERWNILGLGQRKPKVSLEHLVVLESKKGGGGCVARTQHSPGKASSGQKLGQFERQSEK